MCINTNTFFTQIAYQCDCQVFMKQSVVTKTPATFPSIRMVLNVTGGAACNTLK